MTTGKTTAGYLERSVLTNTTVPLTPSHAAAALLLSRLIPALPFGALVIGTMSPDFEYLFRLAPSGRFGHSPLGLVVFCLPVSLVVWVLYLKLIRPALRTLLPSGLAAAVGDVPAPRWLPAALAVLLGALSHILWDAFTHVDGFGVALLPNLRSQVVPGVAWYKLLQHGSTALGAILLTVATHRWMRYQPATALRFSHGAAIRSVRMCLVLLSAAMVGGAMNAARVAGSGLANLLGFAAVGTMAGLACALLVFGLVNRYYRA